MASQPNPIIIQQPDEAAMVARLVSPLVARAAGIAIASADDDEAAQGYLVELKRAEQNVGAELDHLIAGAHTAHKGLTSLRARALAPIAEARRIITAKINAYQDEQRRIAAAAQRELEEKIRREEEDRRRREAAEVERRAKEEAARLAAEAKAAREAGDAAAAKAARERAAEVKADAKAEAEAIRSEPITMPVMHVAPQIGSVKGVTSTTRWGARVDDKAALIKWVASRIDAEPGVAAFLDANMSALNRLAVSQHKDMRVGGVTAVSETGRSVRAAG